MSRWIHLAGCAVLAVASTVAGPARASDVSERLCTASPPTAVSFPTDAALDQASAVAERHLDESRFGDASADARGLSAALAALEVPVTGTASPTAGAVARFCYAAGELMRVSPEGSQRQAQRYLLASLRQSRVAVRPELTAQAAYRLGLVSVPGASAQGVRGAGSERRNGTAIVRRLRSGESLESSGAVCSALADVDANESADDASLSMLSLDCAARLAVEAGSPVVSSLASLRFARFAKDWAASSDDPDALLRVALKGTLAALPVAATIADAELRVELLGRLARAALELGGASDPALPAAIAVIRAAGPNRPIASATAAELEARLALRRGDRGRARQLIEEAILHESGRPLPVRLPEYFLLLGEAEPDQRPRHAAAAYAALENIRPRLPRLDPLTEESMFTLHMRRVFESAADVQLAAAQPADAGDHIRTAQQIVETFRQAELQSAVGNECLPPRVALAPDDLLPNETLLYPLLFADRLELIYVTGSSSRSGRRYERLAPNRTANRAEVARLAEQLTTALTRASDDSWRAPARRLYEILIQPIEGHLAPGSSLAIIPDGALRGVPFAALLANDGRFLVEKTALSVAPALAYSQPGTSPVDGQVSIVAASLQKKVSLPAGNFSALAGTANEARIAAMNGAPGTFVEDFTRVQLETALAAEQVDVLHLATHASFNGRSDRAFIVANGELIRLSELREMISKNRARGDSLQLLVLSACETAVGDDETSMGLAGAAVQAGALSAIASLWQVDDVGTSELMRQFYKNYSGGHSRSHSLRDAQLALIKGGGANADPYVWAAFALLGAWR